MPTCWNCNRRFNVPDGDSAEEHGCPRCGVLDEQEDDMNTETDNALDAALAAINVGDGDESQQLVAAKCRGLMRGYDARWREAGFKTLQVEHVLTSDLVNPETHAKSRTFKLAGKLDAICKTPDGRTVLFDHKTTSQDIADPNSPYFRQLVVEGQPSHYGILGWANDLKFDLAIWDVIRKPTISPKKLTKAERASAVADRRYFGFTLGDETLAALQVEERETAGMYEARLAHDCTTERPDWYFSRRPVPRMESELLEYAQEAWDHGQEILSARNTGRNPRNSGACLLYNSPCKFLGICSGHDTPDSDKWRRREFVHAELPIVEGDGRDLLTNSRIRCFQTCRRKHYLQYELGIEQQDEEEREALFFGTLMHKALEAWFLSFT